MKAQTIEYPNKEQLQDISRVLHRQTLKLATHDDLLRTYLVAQELSIYLERFVDWMREHRMNYCHCENNGDYCAFCTVYQDAQAALHDYRILEGGDNGNRTTTHQ